MEGGESQTVLGSLGLLQSPRRANLSLPWVACATPLSPLRATSDTQTTHDMSGECGSLLAAMVCFSGTVQGLRNLENELKTNKQQQAEGLQQSKEQNFSFFKLPGPRGETMCPKHDKAPTGACLRTPCFPAFPRWEDLLNRLCHGNATFYSHFFLVFWLSSIGRNEINTVHFSSLCKTLGRLDPASSITASAAPSQPFLLLLSLHCSGPAWMGGGFL